MTEMFTYDIECEFANPERIREEQSLLLAEHLRYCRDNSPFYRDRLRDIPEPDVSNSFDILSSLPFTTKDDLAENIESFTAVSQREIRDISFSSGTTGKPLPIVYTENDLKRLAYNERKAFASCGMTDKDIVLLTCTMDRCFIAGLAYYEGARAVGASVLRNGLNSLESHAEVIRSMKPSIVVGVPSFLKKLAFFLNDNRVSTESIKKLICIGEPIRRNSFELTSQGRLLEDSWQANIHSTYASSETITSFCDCEARNGGHLHHDLAVVEIVGDDGAPCGMDEIGEVVVTPLRIEGMPLLRFKTGDVSLLNDESCECGRHTPRLGPIAGRKQQMMKIGGTTVYPQMIYSTLESIPGIIDYYIIARSKDGHLDQAEITVSVNVSSLDAETISNRIAAKTRRKLPVRIDPADEVQSKIFYGKSRKPVRFFVVDSAKWTSNVN